ncbi:Glucosamine-6-phosphate deaminase [uncultured archaeon]|nr:Glucosamine-6-phosphate deaminase [uncultured archaeon]
MALASFSFELHRAPSSDLPFFMQGAFADFVSRSLQARPLLLIGLPGGHSLDGFYGGLGKRVPSKAHPHLFFFPVDERLVGMKDKENNGQALQNALRSSKLAHPKQVLRLDTSVSKKGGLAGARELDAYGQVLHQMAPEGADLLILGVGPDGHVASLFPKRKELDEEGADWLAVDDSPKPPARRATLPPAQIQSAREVWLVFRGKEKQKALVKFLDASVPVRDCPAKLALGAGRVVIWTDLQV